MAYKLTKFYPENFSKDITQIVDAITFKHGMKPFLYGSGSYKINYPSDYDLAQEVPVSKTILSDFQKVIKQLLKIKDIYIGDIKSGELPYLKIIPDNLNERNYNEYRPKMIEKINKFAKDKCITQEEKDEALKILIPDLTEMDIYILEHDLRFEVIRWKPSDILKGFVNYRGHKIDFYEYLIGDSMTKIDVIAWINGVRYNEITMVYNFTKKGIPVNSKFENIELALLDQIPYLLHKKKYMKICKRINSIERASNIPKKLVLSRLYRLFKSDLGLLNQVISDISALQFLLDNVGIIPKAKFEYEIDQIKYRLGNMVNLKYLKQQNIIMQLLDEIEKDVMNMELLETLHDKLSNILQTEVLKDMKKWKLFPIPVEYLPKEFKGKGVLVKSNNFSKEEEELMRSTLQSAISKGYGECHMVKHILKGIPQRFIPKDVKGKGNKITMSKPVLLKEHKKLIKVLESGNEKQQLKEAQDQQQEMQKYITKGGLIRRPVEDIEMTI